MVPKTAGTAKTAEDGLSIEEIGRLLDAAHGAAKPVLKECSAASWWRGLLLFGYNTGLGRVAAGLAAGVDQAARSGRFIGPAWTRVEKKGIPKQIYVWAEAMTVLAGLPTGDRVFPGRNRSSRSTAIGRCFGNGPKFRPITSCTACGKRLAANCSPSAQRRRNCNSVTRARPRRERATSTRLRPRRRCGEHRPGLRDISGSRTARRGKRRCFNEVTTGRRQLLCSAKSTKALRAMGLQTPRNGPAHTRPYKRPDECERRTIRSSLRFPF